MALIHHQKSNVHFLRGRLKRMGLQALRRNKKHGTASLAHLLENLLPLLGTLGTIQIRRSDPPGLQALYLIVHQCHQWLHHQHQPVWPAHSRNLIDHRFSKTSSGNEQHVLPLQNLPNGLKLAPPASVNPQHSIASLASLQTFMSRISFPNVIHLSGDLSIYNVPVVHLI